MLALKSHTNKERIDARSTRLDLFHRNVFAKHPFNERRLNLVSSDDSLAVAEHGIPQRCQRRSSDKQWSPDHPSRVSGRVSRWFQRRE